MSSPRGLHEHAADNLVFIREAMEKAGTFTAVPGWGAVVMGFVGLAAAIIAPSQTSPAAWILTWLAAAVIATSIGLVAIVIKSRQFGVSFLSRPARQFALGLAPAIFAGALLTAAFYRSGAFDLIPGMWLLLYGCAVVAGGAFSVRVVPLTGALFIFFGTIALFSSPLVANICLGAGFGGLNIIFGTIIARNHGG